MREDISQILYDATKKDVMYIFGDSISSLTERPEGVFVEFDKGKAQSFDLVIGADGVHSYTRKLVFGDESQFIKHLNCYISIFTTDNYLHLDHVQLGYTSLGTTTSIYSAHNNQEAKAVFFFRSKPLPYDHYDIAAQKKILADACAHETGWEVPNLLQRMKTAPDFYLTKWPRCIWSSGLKGV